MDYRIEKIENSVQIKEFHDLPDRIHSGNPVYRPPFRDEVEQVFSEAHNERFRKGGVCERFLIYRGNDTAGRFALFIDPEKDEIYSPPCGGIGFIELTDSPGIVEAMTKFAKQWHREKGYSAFRGPVNFGENDTYWGILKDGFEEPNVYGMLYHKPWLADKIEESGAEKFDDVYMYRLDLSAELPGRIQAIADRLLRKDHIQVRMIDMKNLQQEGETIRQLYNAAFHQQIIEEREEEFIGITRETIQNMVKKMKPVLIPETSLIATVKGEPASFLVSVPDMYEISVKTGGRFRWWDILRFIGFKGRAKRLRPMAFGTHPKYRGMGLEALIFSEGINKTRQRYPNLKSLEGGFVSEKNWIMRRGLEALGCRIAKTYRVYYWE